VTWEASKQYFNNADGTLVDIYFETMTDVGWEKLFHWVEGNSFVCSVNCYIPSADQYVDYIPNDINISMKIISTVLSHYYLTG